MEANYAVTYSQTEGGTPFAWFITRTDAELFASVTGRQSGQKFLVVSL